MTASTGCTQGATAEMTKAAFVNGKGAIISASRSIMYSADIKDAVSNMAREVSGILR